MHVKRVWKFTFLFYVVFELPSMVCGIGYSFSQSGCLRHTYLYLYAFPLKVFHRHSDISPHPPAKEKFPKNLNVSASWLKGQSRQILALSKEKRRRGYIIVLIVPRKGNELFLRTNCAFLPYFPRARLPEVGGGGVGGVSSF